MGDNADDATTTRHRTCVRYHPDVSLPAISLFSGVGGLDLGAARAGFEARVALEIERDSAASLRANQDPRHPHPVIERSIVEVPTEEILAAGGLRVGEAALVIGGPPCTPFSKSGYWLEYKRTGNDPQASLLDEFARVVEEARPEAVLMENVWSLAYRNHNTVPLARLTGRLEAAGYHLRWEVLNAADFGVPQLRKRLILYGLRGGTPPELPSPTHAGWTETKRSFDRSLLPYVTSRQAIGDLEDRPDLVEADELVDGRWGHLLPEVPAGGNYLHFTERLGHPHPLFAWRGRYWTFLLKLDPDRPSTTIQSQPGPYVGPFHWENRRLRLLEVKRLQTFPDGYVIVARNRRSWHHQLGNAVPPMLAEIVARPLARALTAAGYGSSLGSPAGVGRPTGRLRQNADPISTMVGWRREGDRAGGAHCDGWAVMETLGRCPHAIAHAPVVGRLRDPRLGSGPIDRWRAVREETGRSAGRSAGRSTVTMIRGCAGPSGRPTAPAGRRMVTAAHPVSQVSSRSTSALGAGRRRGRGSPETPATNEAWRAHSADNCCSSTDRMPRRPRLDSSSRM